MRTAINYLKLKYSLSDSVDMHSWLRSKNINYVQCSHCGMTMTIYEAAADKEGYLYCPDCVYETNKDIPPMQLLEVAKYAKMEARKRRR